jgi:Arc/MetJ-type ribon-helix-helix transcriptional regulator
VPRWTVNLSDDLAHRVEERLDENCQNRSEVIRYLLERYVESPAWSIDPRRASSRKKGSRAHGNAPESMQPERKPRVRPAPSSRELAEAQGLASKLGREIPDEALAYRSACSDFIRKAKNELS